MLAVIVSNFLNRNFFLERLDVKETMPSSSQTTATEVSIETDKSARGLLKKSATEASNAPAIFGYIQDVGPTKLSVKNSEYFTFVVQQKDSSVKAVCFSPKKHKSIVEQKAEICCQPKRRRRHLGSPLQRNR